ncbi:MAG: NAD(P)-dependent oxidoreductase [Nitrospirae bacterium]|nr:MAG: NAD(P)-dependent oxidoreductase [Nitrospirota bacterium]
MTNSGTTIGWIGTGIMGAPMCGHLLTRGYNVRLYNRTLARAAPLLDRGAVWAVSPRQVVEQSDVVFTMVGVPQDVRQVYWGEAGLLAGLRPGVTLVDMTTSSPSLAQDIHAAARAKGAQALDAPVSGGDVGARDATLSIMVGGDKAVADRVRPLLELMGKTIVHQGEPGAGQHAKLSNQIVIAGTMIGVCEGLLYGYKAGLDLPTLLQSIASGAAACRSWDVLAPRMLQRDFAPGFLVDHFVKDMGMALDEAARTGLVLPGLALVHQLYLAVQAQGQGKQGTQALLLALETLSNIKFHATSKK